MQEPRGRGVLVAPVKPGHDSGVVEGLMPHPATGSPAFA